MGADGLPAVTYPRGELVAVANNGRSARYLKLRACELLGFALDWFDALTYDAQVELLAYAHLRRQEEVEAHQRAREAQEG